MRVLITAGTVYGVLDDNKLVGNRTRGIWATKFAEYLARQRNWPVTLLVADIQEREIRSRLEDPEHGLPGGVSIVTHRGFQHYRDLVFHLMDKHDAAVMAAAVVNWIPEKPFEGKMPTVGVGDRMNVPFILAPRVIDDIKRVYPHRTVIGCKLTIGADHDTMIHAAYKTLLGAKCNAVVANDMKLGLGTKIVVHQDRTEQEFQFLSEEETKQHPAIVHHELRMRAIASGIPVRTQSVRDFYDCLYNILKDEHYHTYDLGPITAVRPDLERKFDRFVSKYRKRFVKRLPDGHHVFGALAIPCGSELLVSPREKGALFDSRSAVVVSTVDYVDKKIQTFGGKATLNAPLLARHFVKYPEAAGVLHLHEQLPNVPTLPYAPPGTLRDTYREIPGPVYNILGHGFIACLDKDGEIWK